MRPDNHLESRRISHYSERSANAAMAMGAPHASALTTTVWPKSRMLFAIVSKMSKEGALNEF